MKISRMIVITLVCIILGIMFAIQYESVNFNNSASTVQNLRREELKDQLIIEKQNNQLLLVKIAEIEDALTIFQSATTSENDRMKALNDELLTTKIKAGLVDVSGKGVIISINNKEIEGFSEAEGTFLVRVLDIDLLYVLNELRAAGAQAISINDERVTALTEIRGAGKYMMVNGNQLVAPFVIKAISDPGKLESSLRIIGGVMENLEFNRYEVSLTRSENIIIQKLSNESIFKLDLLNIK